MAGRRARAKPTLPEAGNVPLQARSQETVRAIVDGASDVISRMGWEEATTDAICRRAGVAPATLFRYFPDKASLLAGALDFAWERERRALAEVILQAADLELEQAASLVVKSALSTYARLSKIHTAFNEEIGPFPLNARYREIFDEIVRAVEELIETLRAQRDDVRVDDPHVAAFILVRGLGFVMEIAAAEHHEWIASGRLERAMVEHVVRALRAPAPGGEP
jgi:AcrR family transcriptional regulator